MKKFILVLVTMIPSIAFSQNGTTFVTLGELIAKESKVVKNYSGFLINADLVNGQPNISANFVKVILPSGFQVDPFLIIRSDASRSDEQITFNEIDALTHFQPSTVIRTPEHFDNGEDERNEEQGNVIRFDFLNDTNQLRISEWRDRDTGFNVKTALYDNSGNLIGAKFYEFLSINENDSHKPEMTFPKKIVALSLTKAEDHQHLVFKNISELEIFVRRVLIETIQKTK